MAKKVKENNSEKVLSKAEILERVKPIESRVVQVPGWGAGVKMKNLTFEELIRIKVDAGEDDEAKNAMIVAAVCEDLELKDAYKLQKGNGMQFAALFSAVDDFLSVKITDEKIKN